MIRVGFVFMFGGDWLGGENYFRNLLTALYALPVRHIEPVILTGVDTALPQFAGTLPAEVVRSRLFDRNTLPWIVRKVWHRGLGRDYAVERLLNRRRIDVLSHSGQLGRRASVPTIGWIQDFQHRRLPEFFSATQRERREKEFQELMTESRIIVVSSQDAQSDLAAFYPTHAARSRVLRFVANVDPGIVCPDADEVKKRYAIETPYFHLPNHFWMHKNHRVVVDALKLLQDRGIRVAVLATGNQSDHRRPDYFQSLMAHVDTCGVANMFRAIGVVPYPDLLALMRHSVGLINPSFFEGWSSTVEEAKALGKRVILSDIPVHREQAPDRGVYFDPHDSQALADILLRQLDVWHAEEDAEWMDRAAAALPARMEGFARTYQEIVLELFGSRRSLSPRTGM